MPLVAKEQRAAALALGARLRRARGELSRRQLAALIPVSPDTITKIESGRRLPDLRTAQRLDRWLGTRGSLRAELDRIRQRPWEPRIVDEATDTDHTVRFDERYVGPVWLVLYPRSANAGAEHRIELAWGHWHRPPSAHPVAAHGLAVRLHKVDPTGEPLYVRCEPATYLTHHQAAINPLGADAPHAEVDAGWVIAGRPLTALVAAGAALRARRMARTVGAVDDDGPGP